MSASLEFCAALRADTEARVLALLADLCRATKLDLGRVEVFIVVDAVDGEPRRVPRAVRIELNV